MIKPALARGLQLVGATTRTLTPPTPTTNTSLTFPPIPTLAQLTPGPTTPTTYSLTLTPLNRSLTLPHSIQPTSIAKPSVKTQPSNVVSNLSKSTNPQSHPQSPSSAASNPATKSTTVSKYPIVLSSRPRSTLRDTYLIDIYPTKLSTS